MDLFDRSHVALIDQAHQAMLDRMRRDGTDLSRPISVATTLGFPAEADALSAGADLIIAGWPAVRTGRRRADHVTSIAALYELRVTIDAMRDATLQLEQFARARNGAFLDEQHGGPSPFKAIDWKTFAAQAPDVEDARLERLDRMPGAAITAGIKFPAERLARAAAAELFKGGWPEVHVVRSGRAWVAELVTDVISDAKALRELRRGLIAFAAPRGGSWLGIATAADRPR